MESLASLIDSLTKTCSTNEDVLDQARALIDTLDADAAVDAICALLDWTRMDTLGPEEAAPIKRERCRLVSYGAIMHGNALLPRLPEVSRRMVALFGGQVPIVDEELLRTVGNLARYALATQATGLPVSADALRSLIAPIIGGAAAANPGSVRSRFCLLAVHRVMLELPSDMLRAEAMLPTMRALLKVLTKLGDPPPAEALAPLSRATQLVGVHLPETDVHFVTQLAIKCLHAEAISQHRGAVELLRTLAPLLRARSDEPFARELSGWVADELGLLPEARQRAIHIHDLVAAYKFAERRAGGGPPLPPPLLSPAALPPQGQPLDDLWGDDVWGDSSGADGGGHGAREPWRPPPPPPRPPPLGPPLGPHLEPSGSHLEPSRSPVPARVVAAFEHFDRDISGFLDYRELRDALQHYGIDLSASATARIIAAYEVRPDGKLDLYEFQRLIHDIQERGGYSRAVDSADGGVACVRALDAASAAPPPPPYLASSSARGGGGGGGGGVSSLSTAPSPGGSPPNAALPMSEAIAPSDGSAGTSVQELRYATGSSRAHAPASDAPVASSPRPQQRVQRSTSPRESQLPRPPPAHARPDDGLRVTEASSAWPPVHRSMARGAAAHAAAAREAAREAISAAAASISSSSHVPVETYVPYRTHDANGIVEPLGTALLYATGKEPGTALLRRELPPRVGGGYDLTRIAPASSGPTSDRLASARLHHNAASVEMRRQIRRDRASYRASYLRSRGDLGGSHTGSHTDSQTGRGRSYFVPPRPTQQVPVEIYAAPPTPGSTRRVYREGGAMTAAEMEADRASRAASRAAAVATAAAARAARGAADIHLARSLPVPSLPGPPPSPPRSCARSPSISPELAAAREAVYAHGVDASPAVLQSAMQRALREAAADLSERRERSRAASPERRDCERRDCERRDCERRDCERRDRARSASPASRRGRGAADNSIVSVVGPDEGRAKSPGSSRRRVEACSEPDAVASAAAISEHHARRAAAKAAERGVGAEGKAAEGMATAVVAAARGGVELLREGRAVTEDQLIAQLRNSFVSDLGYLGGNLGGTSASFVSDLGYAEQHRASQDKASQDRASQYATSTVGAAASAAVSTLQAPSLGPMHIGGGASDADAALKRNALSSLLSMRAKEIEATQREQCVKTSRQLVSAYQQQVARLQAALVRQLTEVSENAQRNVHAELQAFMQLGLPAIQHILTSEIARDPIASDFVREAVDPIFGSAGLQAAQWALTGEEASFYAHKAAAAAVRSAKLASASTVSAYPS